MRITRAYAVEAGGVIPDCELSPVARRIVDRMAQTWYVIHAHQEAIALHTRRMAELEAELARIEGER